MSSADYSIISPAVAREWLATPLAPEDLAPGEGLLNDFINDLAHTVTVLSEQSERAENMARKVNRVAIEQWNRADAAEAADAAVAPLTAVMHRYKRQRDELATEAEQLRAKLKRVTELHRRQTADVLGAYCAECSDETPVRWPCPTAQALGVTED